MSIPPLKRKGPRLAVALLPAALALAGAGLVQAEVISANGQTPKESDVAIHEEPVALECWQEGRRIIHQDGLRGLAIKAVTRKGAVAFKPVDSDQPEIFLLPFEDSLCLVSPED